MKPEQSQLPKELYSTRIFVAILWPCQVICFWTFNEMPCMYSDPGVMMGNLMVNSG